MEKIGPRLAVFGFVLAVVLQCSSAQTVHIVGDSLGWTVRSNLYGDWAANNNFAVGDILTFNFETNEHDVLEVMKESYDACSSNNPIGSLITTGPANISLTKAGDHFYICTVGRHCLAGQKLAITVSATAGAPSPRSSTPRTTPTTPSPAGEEACAPTPEGSTRTSTSIPPSPPPSSSAGVGASHLLVLFAITVVGWLL